MYVYSAKSTTTNEYETAAYPKSHQISLPKKNSVAQPPKNTEIILPPSSLHNCFSHKWLVHFPSNFRRNGRQIFRALKQAVKPSIQSWQNPTSVALNDFGAVRETGETGIGDGWISRNGFVRINGDRINGL